MIEHRPPTIRRSASDGGHTIIAATGERSEPCHRATGLCRYQWQSRGFNSAPFPSARYRLPIMQPPMIGNWLVRVNAVRPFTIHGDLYYELHIIRTDAPGDTAAAI